MSPEFKSLLSANSWANLEYRICCVKLECRSDLVSHGIDYCLHSGRISHGYGCEVAKKTVILFRLFIVAFSVFNGAFAQSSLTIDQIMQGPDFVGYLPTQPFWSPDGQHLFFQWNPEGKPLPDLYKWSKADREIQQVPDSLWHEVPPSHCVESDDGQMSICIKDGDLFLFNRNSGKFQQITKTVSAESNVGFSLGNEKIIFQKGDNLYTWDISTGTIEQITQFIKGNAEKEKELSEQRKWLKRDQLEYFSVLKERSDDQAYREKIGKMRDPIRPRPIYLNGKGLSALSASPDLRYIFYRLTDQSASKRTQVPAYVTEDGYLQLSPARAKVGSAQNQFEFWIYDRSSDTSYIVDPQQIPFIYDKPDFLKLYHSSDSTYVDTFSSPRSVIFHGPFYNASGNRSVLVIRSQDNKDRWIMSLDPVDGGLNLLDRQRDTAWIGGPGISGWNFSAGNVGWIDDQTFWFHSEVSGYSHLYSYNFLEQEKSALTSGDFEITQAQLSKDSEYFFLQASKKSPFENHFYRLSIENGEWEQITTRPGSHLVTLSPDEHDLAVLYSYSNRPTELYIMDNQPDGEMLQVTESTTEAFNAYPWRDPEIVYFQARDGASVPARMYKPTADQANGAAVIFVHGAGYLHNVHKWWSSYYREYMFHNLLTDHGYTVLDIDYRASAGYGRDWRTAIYRHMGSKDLSDQVDGARYLIENHSIDPDRVGIYGGSYGGFITLMALCTAPGTFACGAALRSVTDWAHYNHGYTSNILNTPMEDSIAYYRSSPIYHAEHLEGKLIMLHGMVDSNVQFQDVVRMSQRFIEAGKDHWELSIFPMEGHGFVEPSSWADEYKRIFRLFEDVLR